MRLLAISYGRDLLDANSRGFKRMQTYATELEQYDIIVFTRSGESYTTLERGNVRVHPTNSHSKIRMLFDAITIGTQILKESRCKDWVVTSQDPFETSLVGAQIARTCSAAHHIQLHGDFYGGVWVKESLLNRLRAWWGIRIMRKAARIRVVSKRIQASLVTRGLPAEKIDVVPIATDLVPFLTAAPGNDFSQLFDAESIVVLTAARLEPEKNIPMLIEAFNNAHSEVSELRLVIVGKGSEEKRLIELVSRLDLASVVTFLPWTNSVASLMASADLYALTSHHEGWAMALVESMATGTPAVTTRVGCVGELFVDTEHGIVIDPGDSNGCAEALIALARDPEKRAEMGSHARHRVASYAEEANNSTERIIESYHRALQVG